MMTSSTAGHSVVHNPPLASSAPPPSLSFAIPRATGDEEAAGMVDQSAREVTRKSMTVRSAAAAALILVAALAAVAFILAHQGNAAPAPSPSHKPGALASPSPTASPTLSTEATAAEAALAAYLGYQRVYEDAAQTADERVPGLEKFARGNAVSRARLDMRENHIDGTVYRGRDKFSPQVTQVLLGQQPERVVLTDCVDGSAVRLVNQRTGALIQIVDPQGRPTAVRRHPALAWVEYVGGTWYVTQANVRADKSC